MNRYARAWLSLLALAALVPTAVGAQAQAPDAGRYSAPEYEPEQLLEQWGVMVPMRDGVRLSVDIYRPKAAGKFASILVMTPYDNTRPAINVIGHPGGRVATVIGRADSDNMYDARWFAQRGYVVVVADMRGRYDSEGEWDWYDAKHKTDGYDLVEWMATQPWSNGKVGMMGTSGLGLPQWWTASTAPPHLAAIVPIVAPADHFEDMIRHGVLMGWPFQWAALMGGRTFQIVSDKPGYAGWQDADLKHTPYIEINRHRGMLQSPWVERWYRYNKSTDPYWQAIAYQGKEHYSRMKVASLNVSGWFDDTPAAGMNYMGMKQYGATPEARRPSLVLGPWGHLINIRGKGIGDYGPTAVIDVFGYVTRWFDHFLKGLDNGVEKDPPVYVFVMGANKWHAEEDWPLPQTQWTRYYLDSKGGANSLKGNGGLTTTPPRSEVVDTYAYDPLNPTQSPGGPLPQDTRLSAIGDEVLVYQTPPLKEAIEVTGPIEAKLYASTSARDTDWFVRLVDVHPDGYSALLADGCLRARNRDPANEGRFNAAQLSTIEPNRVYEYTIRFARATGNLFKKGHRIRVEISSSWFPTYLPNLNTGADNVAMVTADQAVVATQKIYHGGKRASHVVLPVIPAGARAARTAGRVH